MHQLFIDFKTAYDPIRREVLYNILIEFGKKVKVKQSRYKPGVAQCSRKSRLPDYMTTAQDGGKVVSPTHRLLFTPRKCSWYSFLLEAESTPGPWCDRKDCVNEKFQ